MHTFTDDDGNVRSDPMIDEDSRPARCLEAIKMRDALLEELDALPVIGSALDYMIGHFGTDKVAEVTGRSRRSSVTAVAGSASKAALRLPISQRSASVHTVEPVRQR